ncbi:endolytic transglycosylase MltG [Agromyces sp. M3QZ16-3]|uniref:endolytic transglycosylase MltG n=1 Tax=Agromyces sp. M3QZ16-3 TaxID=3447585 RepID=UPI003F69126C
MTRRELREMEQRQAAEAAQRAAVEDERRAAAEQARYAATAAAERQAAMEARRAAAEEAERAAEAEWRAAQAAPQAVRREEVPPPQSARVARTGSMGLPGQHPVRQPAREPVAQWDDEGVRGDAADDRDRYAADDRDRYATDDAFAATSTGPLRGRAGAGPDDWPPTGGRGLVAETDPHHQDPFADLGDDASRPSRSDRRAAAAWEFEEHEREPNRRRRGAWGCLIALIVLGALVAGAAFFLQGPITSLMERFQPPEDYTGAGSGEVVFMINEGDGGETIAANLEEQDIVASSEAFIEEVTSRSEQPIFYPGAYRMANQMSADAALDALLDPENKLENTFVIQEGLWARDALANAAAATGIPVEDLQAAAADPQALGLPAEATGVEGFLFPATYTFGPDVTADEVVQTLVDRSFQALDDAGVAPEDRWETVIIASMIEREAGSEEDAYKVSRVIRNRLDANQFPSQLLQFDSTVHYGTGDDTVVTTTDAERADPANPYNTYVHPGLPPGPIGNPGDVAIDAAQNPADGPWLYFVTVNLETGETVFSATLEEHEAAVEQFLRYLDENG